MDRNSVLQLFVEWWKDTAQGPWEDEHILEKFNVHLVGRSDETRKAYNTDVWIFLSVLWRSFWDYPFSYKPVADAVSFMSALDKVDERFAAEGLSAELAAPAVQALIHGAGNKQPATDLMLPDRRSSIQKILADMRIRRHGDRMRMVIDPTETPAIPVHVAKAVRLQVEFVVGSCHDQLDRGFWDETLRPDRVARVLQYHELAGVSKNTSARRISSIRCFEQFLFVEGLLSTRAVMLGLPRPRIVDRAQLYLEKSELVRVIQQAKKVYESGKGRVSERQSLLAIRNLTMLTLMHRLAIRGTALCNLKRSDVNIAGANSTIRVTEKGRKERYLPLGGEVLRCLQWYLRHWQSFVDCFNIPRSEQKALFFTKRKAMNRRSASRIVAECAQAAGIKKCMGERQHVGTHVIRRSRASELYNGGASIDDVQLLLGHANPNTTRRYIRHNTRDLRAFLKRHDGGC